MSTHSQEDAPAEQKFESSLDSNEFSEGSGAKLDTPDEFFFKLKDTIRAEHPNWSDVAVFESAVVQIAEVAIKNGHPSSLTVKSSQEKNTSNTAPSAPKRKQKKSEPQGKQDSKPGNGPAKTKGKGQSSKGKTPAEKNSTKGSSKPTSAELAQLKVTKEAAEREKAAQLLIEAENREKKRLSTLMSNFPSRPRDKFSPEQKSVWRKTVESFAAQYHLDIANGPDDQIKKAKELGLSTREPRGTYNDHTLGAAARAALRRRACVKAITEGHTSLVELFGNQSSGQFVTDLGEHLTSRGWQGKLEYLVTGEILNAKDFDKRDGKTLSSQATFGLIIDAYDHPCMRTPDELQVYIKEHHAKMEILYIVHNVMEGYAGHAPGYTWTAPLPDTRLVQIGNQQPFEHFYPGWMDVRSHTALAGWYLDRSHKLSNTVSMAGTIFRPVGSIEPPPKYKVLKQQYQYFGVYEPVHRRVLNYFKGESPMILLDSHILDSAMAQFSGKNPTEFTYSAIKTRITNLLKDEAWVRISSLLDYSNDRVAGIMTDLVLHRTFLQSQASYSAINPYIQKYKSVSSSAMFTPQQTKPWGPHLPLIAKIVGGGSLALICYLLATRKAFRMFVLSLLTRRAAGSLLPIDHILNHAVCAPVIEETLKRWIPGHLFTVFIIVVETYRDANTLPLYINLGRSLMHAVAAAVPYKYGVVLHALWNLAMIVKHTPESFTISAFRETYSALRLSTVVNTLRSSDSVSTIAGAGSLVGDAIDAALHMLESNPTSTQEYQDALFEHPDIADFAVGVLSMDCPEFTICPPAILSDEEIHLPIDRTVFHGRDVFGTDEELREWFRTVHNPNPTTKIYHVLTFNGPSMVAPQALKFNPYVAGCLAYGRLAKPMPVRPHPHAWALVGVSDREMDSLNIFGDIYEDEWAEAQESWKKHVEETGKWWKYARFWEHRKDIGINDPRVQRGIKKIQIMSKSDEVLIGKNNKKFLPRPIDNIAPIVAFVTGPLDYLMKRSLMSGKESADLETFRFPKPSRHCYEQVNFGFLKFYWVPCLGFTQNDLSLVMQQFVKREEAAMLLSHGDDTLLVYIKGERIGMLESDLSSCDRSLTGPALKFEYDIIHRAIMYNHLDPQFVEANKIAYKLSGADRVLDGIRVSLDDDAQRPTGCTRTSLMNTVLTAIPLLMYHLQNPHADHLARLIYSTPLLMDSYKYYGLDAKIKVHMGTIDQFPTGTFLKGVWLRSDSGELAWTRLPSMAIKMFKTLKPLPFLTKRYRKEVVDLAEARRRYAVMVATSWSAFDLPFGIREWVAKWADRDVGLPRLSLDGRVLPGAVSRYTFSNGEALSALAKHYDVPTELFIDWCERFVDLEPGKGYCHPVWMALGSDY